VPGGEKASLHLVSRPRSTPKRVAFILLLWGKMVERAVSVIPLNLERRKESA
jgi:hypothetical protein